jgi:ribosomal protein S18 acetylase RimI-like enzyme
MGWAGDGGPIYAGPVFMIRRAADPDADAIARITAEAYQHYVPRIGREPAPMTTNYAGAVRAGQAWVAEDDGQAVGIVVLELHPDHLLVENIAVRPSAQGRGVGRQLLARAEELARELGYDEVRLYTHESMTENIAYYPRRGYTETHRGGQDGYRRVFFRKQLGG